MNAIAKSHALQTRHTHCTLLILLFSKEEGKGRLPLDLHLADTMDACDSEIPRREIQKHKYYKAMQNTSDSKSRHSSRCLK